MTSTTLKHTTNLTAIITGASRGIGRNTALTLAGRSVDIIFTYHSNQTEAESLIREIEAMGRKATAFRLDAGNLRSARPGPDGLQRWYGAGQPRSE